MGQHSVGYSLGTLSRGMAGTQKSSANDQSVTIQWQTDGGASTGYDPIDFDSYFTVPEGCTGVGISVLLRDGSIGWIRLGHEADDNTATILYNQVANKDYVLNWRINFVDGHKLQIKSNINFNAWTRIWIKVVIWYYD